MKTEQNFVSSVIFFIFEMDFSEKEYEKEDVPTASKVKIDATLNIKHASIRQKQNIDAMEICKHSLIGMLATSLKKNRTKMEAHQILESKLQPLKMYLEKNSITEKELDKIKPILQDVIILSTLMYRQRIDRFQRVTVNNWIKDVDGRVEYIKHLKNPPKECVKKYGRANMIGQSVLYATFDYITALSEMRPEVGEKITVSYWKLKTDYDLCVTPIFKNSTKNGVVHNELSLNAQILSYKMLQQYDENVRKQIQIILQFIADAFSKEVQDGNHFDYYLSSHYANRLLYEFENGELDGILYPSVRQSLTLSNIALKQEIFDKHFELEKVEESIITSKPTIGSNGWTMKGTGYSTEFKDEKIIWDKASG